MRIRIVNSLIALNALAGSPTGWAAGSDSSVVGIPLDTNAVQRVVLNPMQVTRIPVAMDRLTTIRFPSPMSDLVSAFVTTEVHPSARFLLTFQPGEAFFSLRAMTPEATTTLNVVWKSQTYVLDLVESSNPWLSVIMTQPEIPKAPRPSSPPPPLEPRPWAGYLETAKSYEVLKRKYPTAMPDVQVWNFGHQRTFGAYVLQVDQLFHFRGDEVLVMKVSIVNTTPAPLHFGTQPFSITIGKGVMPVLLTDFDGALPGGAEAVAFIVFQNAPASGGKTSLLTQPINVSLRSPSPSTGAGPLPRSVELAPEPSGKGERTKASIVIAPAPGLGRGAPLRPRR